MVEWLLNGIKTVEYTWRTSSAHTPFLMLLMISYWYLGKSNVENIKRYLVYPALFYGIVLFFPPIQKFLLEEAGFAARFHRLYWIIPLQFVFSYVLFLYIEKNNKMKKTAIIIFALCVIAGIGKTMVYDGCFITQNIYKLDDGVLEISRFLEKEKGKQNKRIFLNDEILLYSIQQYDPTIILLEQPYTYEAGITGGQIKEIYKQDGIADIVVLTAYFHEKLDVEVERIREIFADNKLEYVILDYEEKKLVEENCLKLLGKAGNYYVYYNLMIKG